MNLSARFLNTIRTRERAERAKAGRTFTQARCVGARSNCCSPSSGETSASHACETFTFPRIPLTSCAVEPSLVAPAVIDGAKIGQPGVKVGRATRECCCLCHVTGAETDPWRRHLFSNARATNTHRRDNVADASQSGRGVASMICRVKVRPADTMRSTAGNASRRFVATQNASARRSAMHRTG